MPDNFVSIIIPVYNEEQAVAGTVEHIHNVMKDSGWSYEVIAVNDGSRDRSAEILDKCEDIHVIHNAYNLGYGASLKRGITASKGEWILITDADGTYPIDDIPKLLDATKTYDMVVGSRTGRTVSIPLVRKPAKLILSVLANFITGRRIPDLNSGFRVFRKDIALQFFHLFPKGFSFTITITLACLTNEYTVKYIPVNYYQRKGSSSIRPIRDFVGFFTLLLRMATLFKPLMVFSAISASLFALAIAIFIYSNYILGRILDVTIVIVLLSSLQIFIFGMLAEIVTKEGQRQK